MDLPCPEWQSRMSRRWESLSAKSKRHLSELTQLEDLLEETCRLLNQEDTVFLLDLSKKYDVQKDPTVANHFREQGNSSFRKRDYAQAMFFYSKGTRFASAGSETLALCFANRSACLFYLQQYQECLTDIRRALDSGYPKHLEPKLLRRREECILKLSESASKNSESTHQVSGPNLCDPNTLNRCKQEGSNLNKAELIPCCSAAISLQFNSEKGRHLVAKQDIAAGEVILEERAFACVLINEENTKTGSENSALMASTQDWYCHHCLCKVTTPVPCHGCSYACYCTEICKDQAWKEYHITECPISGMLLGLGIFTHLAFRLALKAEMEHTKESQERTRLKEVGCLKENELYCPVKGTCKGLDQGVQTSKMDRTCSGDNKELVSIDTPLVIPGCDLSGCYQGSYSSVYSLLLHFEKHTPQMRFLYAITVTLLWQILKEGGQLPDCWSSFSKKVSNETQKSMWSYPQFSVIGVMLLRHMLQMKCNAQAVTTVSKFTGISISSVESQVQTRVATGIFPTVSLMNHSCDPNTSITFQKNIITVRTTRPLKAGEELLHCYGPHRSRMNVFERQHLLEEQYFFQCQCKSCKEEKSELSGNLNPGGLFGIQCSQCGSSLMSANKDGEEYCCSKKSCGHSVSQQEILKQVEGIRKGIQRAVLLIETGQQDQARSILQKCQREAWKILIPTHPMQGEIEDCIARVFAVMERWDDAATHLSRSIELVRNQYGKNSLELGHQLFKLAQLQFNGCVLPQALSTISEAEQILTLHCGPNFELVQELQEMSRCLQDAVKSQQCFKEYN
ncbi:SET and MYND domain-containing protein 4 [Polypterus senegalus]|uniref:SET and MYND domain-containing protein 4 n=1 Tax=Polypterus senegalus TaxID=55291 RepID=UPI001966BD65|nr:SET and MYND domain-containing protein 4 [Polypterus senegalus]